MLLKKVMLYLFLKFVVRMRYKLEVFNCENIPAEQGVMILGNHVSWLDWIVVQLSVSRPITFVMNSSICKKWYFKYLLTDQYYFTLNSLDEELVVEQLAHRLDSGEIVVVFPEEEVTHNGHLGHFNSSFEKILKRTKQNTPVMAFYIRGLWESMFSKANQKYVDSYRTNTLSLSFCKPFSKNIATAEFMKLKIMNLTIDAWRHHINHLQSIPCEIFDRLKEVGSNMIVADSTGLELSGYKFLTAATLFKEQLEKKVQGQNIALMLPATAAGAFVNTSVLMMGKCAVNLNFTADEESLCQSIKLAEIKSLVTSKAFVQKLLEKGIKLDTLLKSVDVIYLEDIKPQISKAQSIKTFLMIKLLPVSLLKQRFIQKVSLDSTALIMFSSGSEGTPKGIELSHKNILGNTQQFGSILNVHENDVMVGSLPLFHAFGLCVTTFYPLIEGVKMVAHPDPTDGYEVAKLVQKYQATMIFGTSTFYRLYILNKKIEPEMFKTLRFVVAGAEKLSAKVRDDFKKRFDKEILEGYGTTETSPVASCNLPDIDLSDSKIQKANKIGSVGMPIPGTSIKIVDPDSFEVLPIGREGLVLIGGVQIMKGYLNNAQKTHSVIKTIDRKSWYVTGDKGYFDKDGFLTIIDRYSRFAKLGGEMVSMGAIESRISSMIQDETIEYLATSIKDEKKGEKIVLLLCSITKEQLTELQQKILKSFDNKLMIPSVYKVVPEIPKLGSGKKDFAKAKKMAESAE